MRSQRFPRLGAAWTSLSSTPGIALACPLVEIDLEAFRRLERVNVEGTLLVLAEAGRHFARQNIGGDVILISTKNVFAPGAGFGAYSATKAAAHQLARIASLEFAPLGVRVNMVAPDAVFSGGAHKSGLWAEVGPGRMKARGLDEKGLGGILPQPEFAEGQGHRRARRQRRFVFRHAPDADHRCVHSRGWRIARRRASVNGLSVEWHFLLSMFGRLI